MKRGPHNGRYILDGKIPVPEPDLLKWAHWMEEDGHRIVRQDDVGELWVSTCFLGLDHDWTFKGPPMLFETMVFRKSNEEDARGFRRLGFAHVPGHIHLDDSPVTRTPTWELALETHAEAVAWAKERLT